MRQAHADRELEAQQLFDEGKSLMAEHRLDEACKKFEASHRLAASAATLMNLGACQEAAGRLASAWGTFRQAVSLATRTDPVLVEPSRKRAEALQPRVSSLQIDVPASSRVAGLEIMRNGVLLDEAQWGSSQYVDGGEYEIVARAPGTVAWTARVAVATELDRKEVEIPRLIEAASDGGGGGGGDAIDPGRGVEARAEGRRRGGMTTLRKAAIGATAGGVLALVGGVVLGLKANGLQSDSDAICPTTTCNDEEGLRLNRDARSTGTKATILFVAGGALTAAGVTLWIVGAPRRDERGGRVGVTPMFGDGAVGLRLVGAM
jgi:hypothetical protein